MPLPEAAAAVRPLTETAYAKINLALHVRARRDDGYHALESIFAFAEDGDVLSGKPYSTLSLQTGGIFSQQLQDETDNLVLRAACALRTRIGQPLLAARLDLDKRLPVASGIGGGSADAAAALRLLIRIWDIEPERGLLHEVALSLGSDVPACLSSHTQFVGGRGEQLERVSIEGLEGAPLLLVNPRIPLSTGPVFARWDGVDRGPLVANSIDALAEMGRNDLEAPATAIVPQIGEILAALRSQPGTRLVRMSGSGATCFALFTTVTARNEAAAALQRARPEWWMMTSRIRTA